MKKRNIIISVFSLLILFPTFGNVFNKNEGESKSIGTVSNGQLINGYKIQYKGGNFKY